MPDRPIPDEVWGRLRRMLAEIKAQRRSCRVVVVLNVRQGEPVDGDVLATEPAPRPICPA